MKKKLQIITLLSIWANMLFCQTTPLFQITFYFEDAVGNRDSCIAGFDPAATSQLDAQFGELKIATPFDSIFEVRIAEKIDLWHFGDVSKIQITRGSYLTHPSWPPSLLGCFVGGPLFFFVKAVHWPVKVSWNRRMFRENKCINCTSMIINRRIDLQFPPYFIEPDTISCLAVDSTFYLNFSNPFMRYAPDFHYYIQHASMGNPKDTIFGVKLMFSPDSYGSSPVVCVNAAHIFVSDKEPQAGQYQNKLSLYPNPVVDLLKIRLDDRVCIERWNIHTIDGRELSQGSTLLLKSDQFSINVSEIPKGIHVLKMVGCDGRTYVRSFIKN